MDDLKYNTQGPFTSEHQIFHASSRTSSYDTEVGEATSPVEKRKIYIYILKCVVYTMSECTTGEDNESQHIKTDDEPGKL